ncbi:MAG: hypothetical protein J1F18_05725 [Lachnospiraceae bacterium]|nr:hypothetical protein [Lachnospiraceae bacterium]
MAEKHAEKKIEVTHHIVYSTKGGCGKTAFSLFLAFCDNFKKDNDLGILVPSGEKNHNSGKHYLIDLDLLGSSLEYYLCINRSMDKDNSGWTSTPTLQELVCADKHTYEIKSLNGDGQLVAHMHFDGCRDCGINNEIFLIPVSALEKEKAMFHVKKGTTPLLRYEELEAQLYAIQQSILIGPEKNKSDVHFVYDLAPNADSYTDAVINEIFDRVRKQKEGKQSNENIVLYLVSNSAEMLNCNIDWLNRLMCGHVDYPCSVVLVNNDNASEFGDDSNNGIDSIKGALKLFSINESVRNTIKAHFFFKAHSIPMAMFRHDKRTKTELLRDPTNQFAPQKIMFDVEDKPQDNKKPYVGEKNEPEKQFHLKTYIFKKNEV